MTQPIRQSLVLILMIGCLGMTLPADLHAPNQPLVLARTEWFDIIFPAASSEAAAYLASFADRTYAEIAARLNTTPSRRLTVTITPDSEVLSGYYSAYPYPRIVLYQAPIDINADLGNFQDDLYKLFYHELTHAVSLSIRSPVQHALVSIFGSPAGFSNYTTPMSFVEGVTVSFESLDGFGRTTDPYAAAMIRQDILEGAFKTWNQAAGAWNRYPAGAYYIYGGYFSRYIQERFGMEHYARLWQRIGTGMLTKPFGSGLFSKGHFHDIYGVDLEQAWTDFRHFMAIKVPVYMDSRPLRPLSSISAFSTAGDHLVHVDRSDQYVYLTDTQTGLARPLFRAAFRIDRIQASTDAGRLLISTVRIVSGLPRLQLKEWDMSTATLSDLPYRRLRDASYGPEGSILAVQIDGYRTHLVMAGQDGVRTILAGNERLSYATPLLANDGRTVYALARIDGATTVIRIETGTSGHQIIERLVLPPELAAIRYLSTDGRYLYAGWDDNALSRLLTVDTATDTISFQTVPINGGVHWPVNLGGRIYYLGRFSAGMAPCVLPADRQSLGFSETMAVWQADASLSSAVSVYDTLPELESSRYSILPWLWPRFWHPSFAVTQHGLLSLGAVMHIQDPAERLNIILGGAWNLPARALDISLNLAWYGWQPRVSLDVLDSFVPFDLATLPAVMLRTSKVQLGLGDELRFFGGGVMAYDLAAGLTAQGLVEPDRPYAGWSTANMQARLRFSHNDFRKGLAPGAAPYGYGVAIAGRLLAPLPDIMDTTVISRLAILAGVESSLVAALPWAGTVVRLDGGLALSPGLHYGPAGVHPAGQPAIQADFPAYDEFMSMTKGSGYIQGELSIRPISAELQTGNHGLYLHRLEIRAGSRAFILPFDAAGTDNYGWSIFGRLELGWTPAIGVWATRRPVIGGEIWHRPDQSRTGFRLLFNLDF